MTEQRHALRVNSLSLLDINLALSQLANRLDEMQGLRGTPQFHNHPNLGGNRLQNVGQATGGAQTLTYDSDGSIIVEGSLVKVQAGTGITTGPGGVSVSTAGGTVNVPQSFTLVAGTSSSGIAALQTAFDGTVFEVAEVAATPGYNLELNFTEVVDFDTISARICYNGAVTHYVTMELYHHVALAWRQVGMVWHTSTFYHWYTWSGIPDIAKYLQEGTLKLRIYHNTAGNVTHRLYIDYLQLSKNQEIV